MANIETQPEAHGEPNSAFCCRNLASLATSPSPFSQFTVRDEYDVFTAGVVQCGNCLSVYKFDMLEEGTTMDNRIYSLSPLPAESFEQMVSALGRKETRNWVLRLPKWLRNLFSRESAPYWP